MNEVRKAMMKECRKYYDIFSEDEKKAIIWTKEPNYKLLAPYASADYETGITYLVNKVEKKVCVLIPLFNKCSYEGENVVCVEVETRYKDGNGIMSAGKRTIKFESDGMYWQEYGNQVVELPDDTKDVLGSMLYDDFLK